MSDPVQSSSGVLQRYRLSKGSFLPIFLSGNVHSKRALILIGGLTDGMGSLPYQERMAKLCAEKDWTLAQPHWTSAYDGYGTGSLKRDVEELEAAVKHLKLQGKEQVVLMGCSTGCQDLLLYVLSAHTSTPIAGAIFQAPISDREAISLPELSRVAEEMVKDGRGQDLVPRELAKTCGLNAMTAYRAWSLLCIGGDDDYFSSDLPNDKSNGEDQSKHRPLSETFGSLPPSSPPLLFLFGSKDECFPFKLTSPSDLFARWENAARKGPNAASVKIQHEILEGAGHQVEQLDAQEGLMQVVAKFMDSI